MKTPQLRRLDEGGRPFGAAPRAALEAASYVEEEYLLSGDARLFRSTDGAPEQLPGEAPYVTRLIVRRPATGGSGVAHVEPLHPHREEGLTWNAAGESFLSLGHTWVGVTVYPHLAGVMARTLAAARYAELQVPPGGEWSIMADAIDVLRSGGLPVEVTSVILSGWSATGSFCRVFATEGFAAGRTDGVVVFISSGGAGEAGYPRLSPDDRVLPDDHPRRTMRAVGVPVFEVISETEAPSHRRHLREDSDAAGDAYRLYQIAGSAHVENWPTPATDNRERLADAGVDVEPIPVVGTLTDARSDLIARALLQAMVEQVTDGVPAPRADRFEIAPSSGELIRDTDGNVCGGIRSPWVAAPLSRYIPHAVPDLPDALESPGGPSWTPLSNAALAASLVGVREPFSADAAWARYGSEAVYLQAFGNAVTALVGDRMLLAQDAETLRASAPERWSEVTGTQRDAGLG